MKDYSGSWVALITPFNDKGVDVEGLKRNIEKQIEGKTDGLLICGTTGEAPSMSDEEWELAVKTAVEFKEKYGVKIMAGTGTNNTWKTIDKTKRARDLGVDIALVVTPYYNKPPQEGLFNHYKTIAESVKDIDICVYNVPSRTGVNIEPKTVCELSQIENIRVLKEANGKIDDVTEISDKCGDNIIVLSGDDSLTVPMMSVGSRGVISVTANVVPDKVSSMVHAMLEGDYKKALEIHREIYYLTKALFIHTNPIPVKYAAELIGLASGGVRLPLSELPDDKKEIVKIEVSKFYKI